MSTTYNPIPTWRSPIKILADGDRANAANLNLAPKDNADNAAYLKELVAGTGAGITRIRAVDDLVALKALTPSDGDVARIAAAVYVFKAGDSTPADDVLAVADDGTGSGPTGRWLHVSQPVAGVANGLARLTDDRTLDITALDGGSPGVTGRGAQGGDGVRGVGASSSGPAGVGEGVVGEGGNYSGTLHAGAAAGVIGTGGAGTANDRNGGHGVVGTGGAAHGSGAGGAGVRGTGAAGAVGVAGIGGTNEAGVAGAGNGTGAGVRGTGGATGDGVVGTGGATSGAGVKGTAQAGNSNGVEGAGHGTGAGVKGTGAVGVKGEGPVGVEGVVDSSSTNGDGVKGTGKGTGAGVRGVGAAGGVAVKGEGVGDNSIGVEGVGGGASAGTGVKGTGSSGGAGVWGVGGINGVGGRFEANAQRGAINIAYEGEPSNPELGDMVFDTTPLVNKLKVCTQVSPSIVWTALN